MQVSQLPDALTREQILDLTALTDKYNLDHIVKIGLTFKNWLAPHKGPPKFQWSDDTDLQDFAYITWLFKLDADFDYLVSRLAMEVTTDLGRLYVLHDQTKKKVRVRSDLPSRILSKFSFVFASIYVCLYA